MKKSSLFIWLIIIFSFIGLAASVESTLSHYNPAISEFCNVSAKFDCDTVNTSKYSEMFGIPVAVFGLLAYGLALASAIIYKLRKQDYVLDLIILISVSGFLFSLYLTYIEAFVLKTWCLVCVTQQLSILIMMISSLVLRLKKQKEPSISNIHE
ncbi:MAG: vitamin K epoxide reductase family protein [Patescibacteria group bacterium]